MKVDFQPKEKTLRDFGFIAIIGFGLLGFLAHRKFPQTPLVSYLLWGLAVICPLLSLIKPQLLKPIFIVLSIIAFPIGWVVSNVLLGLVFLLMFTPLGLFFRMKGRDALALKLDKSAASYWIDRPTERPAADYYRQF